MGSPTSGAKSKWDALSEAKRAELTKEGMLAWGKWMSDHQAAIVESGGPLGKTKLVSKNGISDITNQDAGYVIIQAESFEAAAKMFLNHPHYTIFPGDSVEVMECLPIPAR